MSDHSGRARRRGGVTPRKRSKGVRGVYAPTGEGVDTCALAIRPSLPRSFDRLAEIPFSGSPDRRMLCEGPGGSRLHYFPQFGVLRLEGRASAILAGTADEHRLADASELQAVSAVARRLVRELTGEDVPDTEAARLDVACDLTCSRDDGLALLRVLRHAKPPRAKWMLYENPHDRAPETVAFVTEKRGRILLRAYDKGLESGASPRGELIRIERQVRVDRGRRRRPANVDAQYLGTLWSSHLRGMSESAREATVGGATTLTQELAARVRDGSMTAAKARGLLGAAYLLPELEKDLGDRTARRWRADLQREGIHPIRDDLPDLTAVPLPSILRELSARFDRMAEREEAGATHHGASTANAPTRSLSGQTATK